MEKRGIRIFCVMVFSIALMVLAGKGGMLDGDAREDIVGSEGQSIVGETEETEQESVFEQYQILNANLLGVEFLDSEVEETVKSEALEYAEEVKEEFTPELCENSSFPEGFIVKLEEALYHSSNHRWGFRYDDFLNLSEELGSKDFRMFDLDELNRLFPKAAPITGGRVEGDFYDGLDKYYDIPEDPGMIFHMQLLPGKDNYLFEYFEPSLRRNRFRLTERVGDKFVTLYEFDYLEEGNSWLGVIQYEDGFYFMMDNTNINMQEWDEVIVCRLSYDSPRDSMRIRYCPGGYVWKECPLDTDDSDIQPLIEDGYMDKVMQDFSSGKYLYEGSREDGAEIYYGDEALAFEWVSEGETYKVYEMDIANCSLPVYMCKKMFLPSAYGTAARKNLGVDFFYLDPGSRSPQKLEELSIQGGTEWGQEKICLVQMWFKEMDGKVYTFRVYNLSNYNYMMSIALVDGNIVSPLKRYFLLPRRKFILEEVKALYQEEGVVQEDKYFKVTYGEDFKYHYALYGRDGKILKEGEGWKQPVIGYDLFDPIIILETYGESGERYTVYYDIVKDKLLETYTNAMKSAHDEQVVYVDRQGEEQVLVVRNIFDRDYYEEFPVDFSSEPITVTYALVFTEEGILRFYYKTGESGTEVSREIELHMN